MEKLDRAPKCSILGGSKLGVGGGGGGGEPSPGSASDFRQMLDLFIILSDI